MLGAGEGLHMIPYLSRAWPSFKYTVFLGIVDYLKLTGSGRQETEWLPWRAALDALDFIDGIMSTMPDYGYFKVRRYLLNNWPV